MPDRHALIAPSSWSRGDVCPGSYLLTKDMPDTENEYSREGTAGHEYAAAWLLSGVPPILPYIAKNGFEISNDPHRHGELVAGIKTYVDEIKEAAEGSTLFVEQSLPIGSFTGEEGAEGTGDAIILNDDGKTLQVRDLKLGMGVQVYAKKNKQLMMYALGARHLISAVCQPETFVLGIHQPRINHFDEWECSAAELEEFADDVRFKTDFIWRLLRGETPFKPDQDLIPTEEGCRFCKAKATCPALAAHVFKTVSEDFVDIDKTLPAVIDKIVVKVETLDNRKLSLIMQNVGLMEDFIKAVRARVEAELFAGHEVPGFKVVEGKRGNRKWTDEKAVETECLKVALTDIYDKSLLSVAAMEKHLKKRPGAWSIVAPFITQNEGKPSVAPSTDPRPALAIGAVEDDFQMLTDETKETTPSE